MSNIKQLIQRIKWRPDKDCFWDCVRGNPITDLTVTKKILEFKIPGDPALIVQELKDNVEFHYKKSKKLSKKSLLKQLYLALYPALHDKYRYFVRPDGTIVFFEITAPGQLQRIVNDMQKNSFEYLLQTDQNFQDILENTLFMFPYIEQIDNLYSTDSAIVDQMFNLFTSDLKNRLTEEPQIISWDPLVPAYRQLSPDLILPGPTPNWDSLLARVDKPELLQAFIWSIFEPRNKGRQVLWVYGQGNDGKSSMVNAIVNFLGVQFAHAVGKGEYSSDFFFGNIVNKRFVVYSDCSNPNALREERMRQMTGNDVVTVNQKYEKAYAANIHAKVMVTSNHYPKINVNEKSEISRLILITIKSYAKNFGDATFQQSLNDEFPHLLYRARELYPSHFPTHMNWEMDNDMREKIIEQCSSKDTYIFGKFIEKRLEFGVGNSVDQLDLQKAFHAFAANYAQRDDRINFDNFKNFLAKNHSLEYISKYGKNKEFLSTEIVGIKVIGEII